MNNPGLYANSNMVQRQSTTNIIEKLLPQLRWDHSRELVLDIGCGTGDVTKEIILPLLSEKSSHIIGIDKMVSMIEYARQHYSHNAIDYQEMDILKLTDVKLISEEKFSKVFSFFCLHWIHNFDICLKNIFEVMEEGGQALLLVLTNTDVFEMYRNMSRSERWKKFFYDVENFIAKYQDFDGNPADDFRGKATRAGFVVQYCEATETAYDIESAVKSKDFFTACNPFVSRIPPDEKEEFLQDCFQDLMRYFSLNSKGGVTVHYKFLEILLFKDKGKKAVLNSK